MFSSYYLRYIYSLLFPLFSDISWFFWFFSPFINIIYNITKRRKVLRLFLHVRAFTIEFSRVFFITIYPASSASNFLGEGASALPIREAQRGGSGWPGPTLGRSFGRIWRCALGSEARSLAEIEVPRDGNALTSLSCRYAEIHPACSPPPPAASSPLLSHRLEKWLQGAARTTGGLSWDAEIYSDDIYKPNWRE